MWKRFLRGDADDRLPDGRRARRPPCCSRSTPPSTRSTASTRRSQDVEGVLDDVDAGDPQTILVLGSDRRWGDTKAKIKPRSDTIILVRLDPSKGATAILVDPARPEGRLPGAAAAHYSDKINAAYSIGGPRATVRKVKELMQRSTASRSRSTTSSTSTSGRSRARSSALGCFYVDVDRRYFNDNAAAGPEPDELRDDRPQARLPEALRPGLARLRPLPPPRHRHRARRAPAALPRRRPRTRSASSGCSATARSCSSCSAATPTPTSARTRRSCGCSSSPTSPRATRCGA